MQPVTSFLSSVLAVLAIVPFAFGDGTLRTVALTGSQAPGAADGGTFRTFFVPAIDRHGHVAFSAGLRRGLGVWQETSEAGLSVVANTGDAVPGAGPGRLFAYAHLPTLSPSGGLAFYATDGLGSSERQGLWRSLNGATPEFVASNAAFSYSQLEDFLVNYPVINSSGAVATATFGNRSTGRITGGIEFNAPGSGTVTLIEAGQAAPQAVRAQYGDDLVFTGGVSYFDLMNFQYDDSFLSINDSGQVAFLAEVARSNNSRGADGIFRADAQGEPELIAYPFVTPEIPWSESVHVRSPIINSSGTIAFSVGHRLFAGGEIWLAHPNEAPVNVHGRSDPVPGFSEEHHFSVANQITMNDAGQLAFVAAVNRDSFIDSWGVWKYDNGDRRSVALGGLQGTPVPGVEDAFFNFSHRGDANPVLNNRGQVAFVSPIARTSSFGIPVHLGYGIWAETIDGELRLIAREGGVLDVGDDPSREDLRVISELQFLSPAGATGSVSTGFNDRGEITFLAEFTDGTSGVFVSRVVAVPEPSGVALIFLVMWGGLGSRCRRARSIGGSHGL